MKNRYGPFVLEPMYGVYYECGAIEICAEALREYFDIPEGAKVWITIHKRAAADRVHVTRDNDEEFLVDEHYEMFLWKAEELMKPPFYAGVEYEDG